jgi:hypothetical protein
MQHNAIENSHMELLSERNRKRIIIDRSGDSEMDTIPPKKLKWLREDDETKNARLRRLEAAVDKLIQQSC